MKLGDDQTEEDPNMKIHEATERIKILYPEKDRKRNARCSETVKTNVGKNMRKKLKLDLPIDITDSGVMDRGNKVIGLPLPFHDQNNDHEIPKTNLHSPINLQTCGHNNITILDRMDPPAESPVCDHRNVANHDRTNNDDKDVVNDNDSETVINEGSTLLL